nr:MAG TPA: hypothetical protein [Caudoviricetes sp.]
MSLFENFIYLQFILSTEDVIQGILFSVPCLISHRGAVEIRMSFDGAAKALPRHTSNA